MCAIPFHVLQKQAEYGLQEGNFRAEVNLKFHERCFLNSKH